MPDWFPVQFDRPGMLWLALLAAPALWIGWRGLTGMGSVRRSLVCIIRALVILLLVMTAAEPRWARRSESLTVILLIDRSKSISPELENAAFEYLKTASANDEYKRPIDKVAVIHIGAEAGVNKMPDVGTVLDQTTSVINREATNLAEGLRLAMAIAPRDSATRLVMVSDGNENVGSVAAAADIARANQIPIDVLRINYDYQNEVLFDRISAPAQARQGQPVALRMVLQARAPTKGKVTLTRNGQVVDLDLESDATSRPVTLREGLNTVSVTVALDDPGPQRFHAIFTPDEGQPDAIAANNEQDAVVIVSGKGRVLLVSDQPEETASLARALRAADIGIEEIGGVELSGELLELAAYDCIVLANTPASDFSMTTNEALRRYVHDIGGGLIMLGGPESFGAGGWIDTPVAKALPLSLDPPEKSQMPRGALVCIMHSSEIPQGNYWGEQCAIAAINALSRLDYAGIMDYDWNNANNNGINWVFPMQEVGDKSAAIAAIKKMVLGDMPDFASAMTVGLAALQGVKAGQKAMIIISDGDPSPPSRALLGQFVAAGIKVSTVIAGGHGSAADGQNMQWIATTTGGNYYPNVNPAQLPQIFIKEAMLVRRSLIVEGDVYSAVHRPSARPGPFVGRWPALPALEGYVLTTPRDGYDPEILVGGEADPLMAHWQYGVGKSVAFTSDAASRWGSRWTAWSDYQSFWEQVVRWSMRAPAPTNVLLSTRLEGNVATLEVETLSQEGVFSNFGKLEGVVISPSLESSPVQLQQVGPGRWRGQYKADEPGAWVVNLLREEPDGTRTSLQAGLSVSFSQEYKALKDNAALLNDLAERTGGRILPDNPADVNLFDRVGLKIPASLSDMWLLLAILASTLFLSDVAVRRLSITGEDLRRWTAGLMGRRESSAGSGMEQLRKARGAAQERLGGATPAGKRSRSGPAAPVDSSVADVRFEAQEGQASGAIVDDISGADAAGRIDKSRSAGPASEGTDANAGDDENHTARLLEARKRARKNQSDGGEGKPPAPH